MASGAGEKKSVSILKKIMIPMVVATLLQAGVFYAAVRFGGTVSHLRRNAYELLDERVSARAGILENEMVERWSNLDKTAEELAEQFSALQKSGSYDAEALAQDPAAASAYLTAVSSDVVELLKRNSVTGAFVILGDSKTGSTQTESVHSGLYIRDLDPDSYADDKSDLLVEAAPPSVTRRIKIPMDALWTAQITFDTQSASCRGDFFYKPWNAALEHPEISARDLGYWSLPFRLAESDIEVISYTVPLIGEDHRPFGVLGVELSLDYLRKKIPFSELDSNKRGAYLLAVDSNEDLQFDHVLGNGPYFKRFNGERKTTGFHGQERVANSFPLDRPDGKTGAGGVGCIHYLKLYNTNTPFENERWALIGIMDERNLLEVSDRLNMILLFSLAGSLVLGSVSVMFTGALLTRPITFLVKKLRESDPRKPVKLEKLHITEIDELSGAIENLSTSVADSASKLTQMIELSDIALGAFELDQRLGTIFYAGKLFGMLGVAPKGDSGYMDRAEFRRRMESLNIVAEELSDDGSERVCRVENAHQDPVWFRLKMVGTADRQMGVLVDISRDVAEKRKIEYERDYDLLTNLLNRRAFYAAAKKRLDRPQELKTGALIMLDLDNLKFVNDTYGHDCGDAYIRRAAGILRRLTMYGALVSRMSGDEFLVFITGLEGKEPARRLIGGLRDEIAGADMPLPDGEKIRIRASAGVAWYPDDSDSLEMLIKYADFAMYKVKNTEKGEFSEFSVASYNRDAYLLHAKEELNKLIDGELVEYAFQPIVDAATGEIHAYEALMRPQLESLKSPFEVLSLARAQSQLYRIERLTWFKSVRDFLGRGGAETGALLFINSIPNQIPSQEDIGIFEKRYSSMLGRIVIELTEEEKLDEDALSSKKECAARWGSSFAIDDFGTGYSGEALLLQITPKYVKVDISIIRGIDTDESRQHILRNLACYAKERGIGIVAEGVETQGELQTVLECGADYLQGYFLGRPKNTPAPLRDGVGAAVRDAYNRAAELRSGLAGSESSGLPFAPCQTP